MRVMVDTDVLLSVIFFPTERTRRLVRELSERQELILCDCVIDELKRLAERKFPARRVAMEQFLSALPYTVICTNASLPRTDRMLEAAEHAGADILLTGDKALLSIHSENTRILSMSEYVWRAHMKKITAWKVLLRSRMKTALTLLLITASTFLFLYNLLEYEMTNRQYRETKAQYWGNLCLDRETFLDGVSRPKDRSGAYGEYLLSLKDANPGYAGDVNPHISWERWHKEDFDADAMQALLSEPYITGADIRYMTAGLSDYTRIDTHSFDNGFMDTDFPEYSSRVIVEATLVEEMQEDEHHLLSMSGWPTTMELAEGHLLLVKDMKLLAGEEEWLSHGCSRIEPNERLIYYYIPNDETLETHDVINNVGALGTPLVYASNHVDADFTNSLTPGQRYVFVLRCATAAWRMSDINPIFYIGDDSLIDWWPYAVSLEGHPENYLETPEFAPLRELIRVTEDDRHTMDVVYSNDMRTIRRYQEGKLSITEGRALNARDTEERNSVCVVSDSLAKVYGLKVGDKVTLRLGDKLTESYAPLGAVSVFKARYPDKWTEPTDFEIVGLYYENGLENPTSNLLYWYYSENAIFIPRSFLPVSEEALSNWTPDPSDVSFIAGDVDKLCEFEEEVLPRLSQEGWLVYYSNMDWPSISAQLKQTGVLSLVKLGAFSVAVIFVLLLTVYLFIFQRKKEFAVMRALGCPKAAAGHALLFPLAVLSAAGVLIGSVLAVYYTSATIAKSLESYLQFGGTINESIPALPVVFSAALCLAMLLLFAYVGLRRIGGRNPLELLQGSSRAPKTKKNAVIAETAAVNADFSLIRELNSFAHKSRPAPGFMRRYILKHMRRSLSRSLLLIIAMGLLFGSMGQFAVLRDSYKVLYNSVDVKARFSGIKLTRADDVAESGFVTGGYYEIIHPTGEIPLPGIEEEYVFCSYSLTNDVSRSVTDDISFIGGYDAESFSAQSENICIMPRSLMEEAGLSLGDIVELNEKGFLGYLSAYNFIHEPLEALLRSYHRHSAKAKIVGCFEGGDGTVYIPLGARSFYQVLMNVDTLSLAEFSLRNYHDALSFQQYADSMLDPDAARSARFSMDTSEADRAYNTYRLIETLYPIAFAAAVLTAAIIMGLMILQRIREAALLRVLGTTKRRTRALLTGEQLLLCFVGVALALAVLFALHGTGLAAAAAAIAVYLVFHLAACAAGSTAAAVNVTKSKVLELLQAKE